MSEESAPEKGKKKATTDKYMLRLEPELLAKSKDLAKRKGTTLASLLRMYLIREIEKEENQ